MRSIDKAYIQYISYYHPCGCLSNEDISSAHPEWTVEKISSKIGIEKRYISAPDETAGDMACQAALSLIEQNSIVKTDINYIILCTQSPDYYLPTTACILQEKLGLSEDCGAFDYNLGCSGFVYGLGIAKGLIVSGQAANVLLLTAETYTKYIHPEDKSCQTIFGDGAAATLITSRKMKNGLNAYIGNFSYKTIGSGFQSLIVKDGGARNFKAGCRDSVDMDEGFLGGNCNLYMDGKAIFDFTAFNVPDVAKRNAEANDIDFSSVDFFIYHQANKFMLDFLRKRCGIEKEKFYIDLADGGNTVSSTIPIAFKNAADKGLVHVDDSIQLCGFGVGLSIGAVVLKIEGYDD